MYCYFDLRKTVGMKEFLLGWAIAATLIALFAIWMLFKKVTTTNNIEDQTIKNKRNKASNIDNRIDSQLTTETKRKKRRLNKLFNKKK
jgi:amino acid permease